VELHRVLGRERIPLQGHEGDCLHVLLAGEGSFAVRQLLLSFSMIAADD